MFEKHTQPLLSARAFTLRMLRFLALGAAIDLGFAVMGAMGFRLLMGLPWLDSFVQAVLVMTGNGPQHHLAGAPVYLFVSLYALTGGTVYVMVAALVLTPALHRLLHAFHLRDPEDP